MQRKSICPKIPKEPYQSIGCFPESHLREFWTEQAQTHTQRLLLFTDNSPTIANEIALLNQALEQHMHYVESERRWYQSFVDALLIDRELTGLDPIIIP